jgi:serine/threonine protein kinase
MEAARQFHLATEYCEFGDLREYLSDAQRCPNGRMPESEAQEVASQVLGGLTLMHREQFSHGDVKPAIGHISIC